MFDGIKSINMDLTMMLISYNNFVYKFVKLICIL